MSTQSSIYLSIYVSTIYLYIYLYLHGKQNLVECVVVPSFVFSYYYLLPTYLLPTSDLLTYVCLSLSTYVNLKIVSTRVFGSKSINNDIYRF